MYPNEPGSTVHNSNTAGRGGEASDDSDFMSPPVPTRGGGRNQKQSTKTKRSLRQARTAARTQPASGATDDSRTDAASTRTTQEDGPRTHARSKTSRGRTQKSTQEAEGNPPQSTSPPAPANDKNSTKPMANASPRAVLQTADTGDDFQASSFNPNEYGQKILRIHIDRLAQ